MRSKPLMWGLTLSISAVVILMLMLEFGLSVLQYQTKSIIRLMPGQGNTFVPNAYYRHTKEGFSEGYINSHGFRDKARTYEKGAETFRILVLGDSFVDAFQVALTDTFPALLETKLNTQADSMRFEVLNLGQSGFGTADAYMRYLNFGAAYDPDLVILAFFPGNDFRNNSKFLDQGEVRFYFVFDDQGHLVLDHSVWERYELGLTWPRRVYQSLRRTSYVANLLAERLDLLRRQMRMSEPSVGPRELDVFSDLNIYLPDLSEPWQEAVDITLEGIYMLRRAVEQHGSAFALITLTSAEQVHPHIGRRLRETHGRPFDYDQPGRILKAFAKRTGMTWLQLLPALREHHRITGMYLHGFGDRQTGHWNETGHRLAADEIFAFLNRQVLVPIAASPRRTLP